MKVQNEHLELIKAAETYLNDASLKNHIKLNVAIDNSKCLINSIASVEPEPLAKNKDGESNFSKMCNCKSYEPCQGYKNCCLGD